MDPFTSHTGRVVPLDRANVDTDAIIPKQFLRRVERSGFGRHLFHEWRFLDYEGTRPNPEFVLNQPQYAGASILLARDNFGCGSSREHAPWALGDYGFRAIVAPSFADIFLTNCVKNGIVAVALPAGHVDRLFELAAAQTALEITVDLDAGTLAARGMETVSFSMDDFARHCLLHGLDHIDWTLQYEDRIAGFEKEAAASRPWL